MEQVEGQIRTDSSSASGDSIARSIFRNTAVMMAAQMVTWISGLVLLVALPRYLGSEGFGRLYLAMSIQLICQWLIDYGGQNYIPKEVSRDKLSVSSLMTNSLLLRVGLWLISLVMTYLLCITAHYPPQVILIVMLLGVSNLWTNITTLLRSCFQGYEDMKYPSIAAVVERSFLMLTVVPALLLGARETVVVVLMAVSTLFSFFISLKYAGRLFRFRFVVDVPALRRLMREGLPYFLWSLFGVIYYRIDAVMLSMMAPDSVVGWYGAAYRFFDILMFLPAIYSQALYPILTRLSRSESGSMRNTSQKSLEFLIISGILICVMLLFFSNTLIRILFGLKNFGPSVADLQIFSVGVVLVYVDFVLGGTVLALDKQKAWAAVAFIAAFVNVGSNYFLIPHFQSVTGNGGIGAAAATDLTELFIMLSALRLLPRKMFDKRLFAVITKGIISGALMGLTIAAGNYVPVPWPLLAAVGILVYFGALLLTGTFEHSEIRIMMGLLSLGKIGKLLSEKRGARA